MRRDARPLPREEFLAQMMTRARASANDFPGHVLTRLERIEAQQHESPARPPLLDLLGESAANAMDLAAWTALAAEQLDEVETLDGAGRAEARERLVRAAACAAEAYLALAAALRSVRRGAAPWQ